MSAEAEWSRLLVFSDAKAMSLELRKVGAFAWTPDLWRHKWRRKSARTNAREVRFSEPCSGCTEVPEYTSGPERGAGCEECGYTGRRKRCEGVPVCAL